MYHFSLLFFVVLRGVFLGAVACYCFSTNSPSLWPMECLVIMCPWSTWRVRPVCVDVGGKTLSKGIVMPKLFECWRSTFMMIVGMFEKNLANKTCDVSWFACVFFEAGIHGLLSTLILCLQRVLSHGWFCVLLFLCCKNYFYKIQSYSMQTLVNQCQ